MSQGLETIKSVFPPVRIHGWWYKIIRRTPFRSPSEDSVSKDSLGRILAASKRPEMSAITTEIGHELNRIVLAKTRRKIVDERFRCSKYLAWIFESLSLSSMERPFVVLPRPHHSTMMA